MIKKVLPLAIATAMMSSFAHADVKLFGTINAEVGSVKTNKLESNPTGAYDKYGNSIPSGYTGAVQRYDAKSTSETITDSDLSNSGSANKLGFAISEKLGAGLEGFALMDWEFDTFESTSGTESANFKNREKYVGIKHSLGHIKFGRIQGIYKTSTLGYDKWVGTGLQARTNGGGMSGSEFGHAGYVDNVIELGFKVPAGVGDVRGTFQYIADQKENASALTLLNGSRNVISTTFDDINAQLAYAGASSLALAAPTFSSVSAVRTDGSMQAALQLGSKDFEFSVAGAQLKLKDAANGTELDKLTNWKVGGKYQLGGLYLALQYEKVKTGATMFGYPAAVKFTQGGVTYNPDPIEYLWAGLGYRMGNVEVYGWAGGIMDVKGMVKNPTDALKEDKREVLGYSLGAMYHFSKNMFAYAGYHKTDDKSNDFYDQEVFLGGLRLNF